MKYVRVRIILLGVILLLVGLVYYEWQEAFQTFKYSPKVAVLGPLAITMLLYVFILPTRLGKPNSTAEKLALLAVMSLGAGAGLVNLYLIDPTMFGR